MECHYDRSIYNCILSSQTRTNQGRLREIKGTVGVPPHASRPLPPPPASQALLMYVNSGSIRPLYGDGIHLSASKANTKGRYLNIADVIVKGTTYNRPLRKRKLQPEDLRVKHSKQHRLTVTPGSISKRCPFPSAKVVQPALERDF